MNPWYEQSFSSASFFPRSKVWLYLTWPYTRYLLVDKTWNLFPVGAGVSYFQNFFFEIWDHERPIPGKGMIVERAGRLRGWGANELPGPRSPGASLVQRWCWTRASPGPKPLREEVALVGSYQELWLQGALGLLCHDRPVSHPLLRDASHIGWRNNKGWGAPSSGTPGHSESEFWDTDLNRPWPAKLFNYRETLLLFLLTWNASAVDFRVILKNILFLPSSRC